MSHLRKYMLAVLAQTGGIWVKLGLVVRTEKRQMYVCEKFVIVQGFATGDCERDAQAISIFMDDGHVLGCSQSYAKNMGLYGQRIGCFSIITEDPKEAVKVESQMKVSIILRAVIVTVAQTGKV